MNIYKNLYQIKITKLKDIKISKDLFIQINDEIFNSAKCKNCKDFPLYPIVFKNINPEKIDNNIVLCKNCFEKLNKDNKQYININNIDKQYSYFLKSFIEQKEIKCINNKLGCKWKDKISNLEFHLKNDCLFEEIKCPNSDCNKKIFRKDLNSHLAQCEYIEKVINLRCQFCKRVFDINEFSNHFKKCPEMVINCEKGCGKKIKRKELEEHKSKLCPEELIKCDYWEKGCKKLIKRKFLSEHYNLEKNNHNNLESNNKEKIEENLLSINDKILPINKKEENSDISDEQIIQNLDFINIMKKDEINKINEQKKRIDNYDYYIPFTEKSMEFITQDENIESKLFLFEYKKIKYSGNYFKNLDFDKYYILLSKGSLDLKSNTNFEFQIYPPSDKNSNQPFPLPWIAFGIYAAEKGEKININNIHFQDNNFKCFDLNGYCYTDGKKALNKGQDDDEVIKLNLNSYITISLMPKDNSFIIKDNFGVTINYMININNSDNIIDDIRFCFIFKGEHRAIVDYNY